MPKSSAAFTRKRKKPIPSNLFMYDKNGRPVSTWEVYEEVKEAFDKWQALRTKDWIAKPRSKPNEREGWVYSPKEK